MKLEKSASDRRFPSPAVANPLDFVMTTRGKQCPGHSEQPEIPERPSLPGNDARAVQGTGWSGGRLQAAWRIFVALIALLCGSAALQAEPLELLLNWLPEPQFGGFYAAELEGLYRKHGLDVKVLPGGSGTPTVQMVAAGKVAYAIASAEEILVARARGAEITALYAAFQSSPVILMAHAERSFKSIAELWQSKGVLAIQSGLPYFQFMQKKLGKPTVTIVPNLAGIASFLSNGEYSQQGFLTSEPLLAAKKGAKVQSFLISELGYNPYLTVLIVKSSYLDKHAAEAEKMVEAVREGWQIYLRTPEKTDAFMHQLNPTMDAETFAASARIQIPLIETAETKERGLGSMRPERWRQLAEQLKSINIIKQIPDLSNIQKTW